MKNWLNSRFLIGILTLLLMLSASLINVVAASTDYEAGDLNTYSKGSTTTASFQHGRVNSIRVTVDLDGVVHRADNAELHMELSRGVKARVYVSDSIAADNDAIVGFSYHNPSRQPQTNHEFIMTIDPARGREFSFWIHLYQMEIPEDYDYYLVEAIFTSENDDIFESATVPVAFVEGGHLSVTTGEADGLSRNNEINIVPELVIEENYPDAVTEATFELTDGFYWDNRITRATIVPIQGFTNMEEQTIPLNYRGNVPGRPAYFQEELTIAFSEISNLDRNEKTIFRLEPVEDKFLRVLVHPNEARIGDVFAKSNVTSPGEILVGKYTSHNGTAETLTEEPNIIGTGRQVLGDIKLLENFAGRWARQATIILTLPEGITWRGTESTEIPEPKRVDGLRIGSESELAGLSLKRDRDGVIWEQVDTRGQKIRATVDQTSVPANQTPAEVVLEGLLVDIDATFEGPVNVSVSGTFGVFETLTLAEISAREPELPQEEEQEEAVPVEPEPSQEIVFTIGHSTYTIDGSVVQARQAPFIRDGRTFLAIRDTATALGVEEDSILWNAETRVATIRKGDMVLEVPAGSNEIYLNGESRLMDTQAVIEEGRLFLPMSPLLRAFGVTPEWIEETQQIRVTL